MDPVAIVAAIAELTPLVQQYQQGQLTGDALVAAWNASVDRVKGANDAWDAAGKPKAAADGGAS